MLLVGGVAFASVKANDYFQVETALNKAQQLNLKGDFQDASDTLASVKSLAVFRSQEGEISEMTAKEVSYIQDNNALLSASTSISTGDFNTAQTSLESISTDFPQYSTVKDKLIYVQSHIQQNLQTQADQAKADAAAQAQAKAAAQAAADEAKAQAAAAAKAKIDAETQASEAQAAQAAQAEEQAAEMRQTAINSLLSIYSSFNSDGLTYYNEGINYSNADDYSMAAQYLGEALATFKSTTNALTDLKNDYSNLDSDISNAVIELEDADIDCTEAVGSAASVMEGTGSAATTNYYSNLCTSYASAVKTFLNSN